MNPDDRLALLSHPEWLKLLRHFELGQGFALIVLLVGDSSLARLCRTELDLWLVARQRPRLYALPIEKPEDLENAPETLLATASPDGPIWINGSGARELYERAWTNCALQLNRIRNTLMRQFTAPLILAGPPWIREILRDTAPDLWSIRAFVSEVSLPPDRTPVPLRDPFATIESDAGIDPDFTLQQADALRGRPDQERQLSYLLDRAGEALMRRGRYEEASTVLQEAVDLAEHAAGHDPDDAHHLHALSLAYMRIGDLMHRLIADNKAGQFFGKASETMEQLVHSHPGDSEYLQRLAISYSLLGFVTPEARDQLYRKSLDIYEKLVRNQPDRIDFLHNLSVAYGIIGDLCFRSGALDDAQRFYEKAVDIFKSLTERSGRLKDFRDLSVVYNRMGDLLTAQRMHDEARQYYQRALDITQDLVRKAPERVDYLRELISDLEHIGSPEALAEARQKLERLTQSQTPNNISS